MGKGPLFRRLKALLGGCRSSRFIGRTLRPHKEERRNRGRDARVPYKNLVRASMRAKGTSEGGR